MNISSVASGFRACEFIQRGFRLQPEGCVKPATLPDSRSLPPEGGSHEGRKGEFFHRLFSRKDAWAYDFLDSRRLPPKGGSHRPERCVGYNRQRSTDSRSRYATRIGHAEET
jgi:hypothetical protein